MLALACVMHEVAGGDRYDNGQANVGILGIRRIRHCCYLVRGKTHRAERDASPALRL